MLEMYLWHIFGSDLRTVESVSAVERIACDLLGPLQELFGPF